MNKVFGYIFTGFGCLVVLYLSIVFINEGTIIGSTDLTLRYYILFPIMFTIFPIGGGLFLIYGENKKGNLFGVILIYLGIILLFVFIDSILWELELSSDPDLLNDLFLILFGIIPLGGGLFLIFRKKEQINPDSHNIAVEDNTSITNTQNNDDL